MDIVRRSDLVLERLKSDSELGSALANGVYSTWAQIVQFGEENTRKSMVKPTFYKHRKIMIEKGISWSCAVVNLKQFSIVPEDFNFNDAKYVDDSVALEVLLKLGSVA